MFWDVSSISSLSVTFLYGAIFCLVVFIKPYNRLRRIFSFYLWAMALWSSSAFLASSGLVEVLPWFKGMVAAPIVMMVAIFLFVQDLFGLRRKWAILPILYGIPAVILALLTNLAVKSATLTSTGELIYALNLPTLIILIVAPGFTLVFVSLSDLIRGYKKTRDANQRMRILYLVIGLCITILSSFVNFTELGKYPIDVVSNGITAILIAYAILRYQLLDIRVVLRTGLLYSLMTAIFGAIYFLIISIVLNFFQLLAGRELLLISILVGALSAIVLTPIRDQAQKWLDRLFYRDKYNAGLMLQRLSETTTSLLDIKKITRMILSEITNTMHIEHAAILIKNAESGNYQVIAEERENKYFPAGFRADHPVVIWLSRKNQPLTSNELALGTLFKSLWQEEKDELERFKAEIFLPLNTKGDLIGIIVLGKKLSSQPFTQDEQLIFSTLSNQTAVTIENARLYDELRTSFIQTVIALANAIDIRDTYTKAHSQEIADLAAKTARALGCSPEETNEIYLGGLLHDIGKIGIPDTILQKTTKLDQAEWEIVHKHPVLGATLISPIKRLAGVSPMIESSHERYDGLGYPHGIKGEEIPLGARIISVVDSFSAMQDKRPYKEPYSREKIIFELKQNSGKMYDPRIVEVFLKVLQAEEEEPSLPESEPLGV